MGNQPDHGVTRRPIVGVFVNKRRIEKLAKQDEDFRSFFWFKELFHMNNEAEVTLYAFHSDDVDFGSKQITGTFFNESSGMWEQRQFPFPDVLHIKSVEDNEILNKLVGLGAIRLNAKHLFSKWDLYKKIRQNKTLRRYLPATVRITSENDLRKFLSRYNTIYIKPYFGSRGRSVIRVKKLYQSGYEYEYNYLGKLSRGHEKDIKNLFTVLKKMVGGKRILAQKAIDLIAMNNRLVDFRAEVQRGQSGSLEVVAISARIGDPRSPITTHADVLPFHEFWKTHFYYSDYQVSRLMDRVVPFLKSVYKSVETAYGSFGDIGIDFSVDKKGNLWLIECNARSAKISFKRSVNEETMERAFINPLEYAKFLYSKSTRGARIRFSTIEEDSSQGDEDLQNVPQQIEVVDKFEEQSEYIAEDNTEDNSSYSNVILKWYGIKQPPHFPTINLKPRWTNSVEVAE